MPDLALRALVDAVIADDGPLVSRLLAASPELALESFQVGASRQAAETYYLREIESYLFAGDTALHLAAAGYRTEMVSKLIAAGASVRAKNRHGYEPLHSAAVGAPGSHTWNPAAQVETIGRLIESGADPNATDKRGVTPLHRAVRTRCAAAVRALLEHGADPARKNKNGSSAMLLATQNTGRGGTGSPEAKAQRAEIVRMLEHAT
jgi:hypothetical protein